MAEKDVTKEELKAGATASLYKNGGSYRMQDRDVIKSWHNKSGPGICSLGAENQAEIDRTMPVRVMSHDAAEYKRQLKHGEELCPVATIVLNFNKKRWEKPRRLLELLDVPREIGEVVQDYRITVYDIAFLDDMGLSVEQVQAIEKEMK